MPDDEPHRPVPRTYSYHPQVLERLAGHGLMPQPTTPPERLRDALSDLYRYEIRRARAALLAGRVARADYARHIIGLRMRYPLLSIPTELWLVQTAEGR